MRKWLNQVKKKIKVKIVNDISLNSKKTIDVNLTQCLKTKTNFDLRPPSVVIIGWFIENLN